MRKEGGEGEGLRGRGGSSMKASSLKMWRLITRQTNKEDY